MAEAMQEIDRALALALGLLAAGDPERRGSERAIFR
jgi:hypothetical protein